MPLTGPIPEGQAFFCPRCGAHYGMTHSRRGRTLKPVTTIMLQNVWSADKRWLRGMQLTFPHSSSFTDLKTPNGSPITGRGLKRNYLKYPVITGHRNRRGDGLEKAYEQGSIKPHGLMHLRGAFLLLRFGALLFDPFDGLPALIIINQIVRTAQNQLARERPTSLKYARFASDIAMRHFSRSACALKRSVTDPRFTVRPSCLLAFPVQDGH